ncbi:MAG: RHS repeat protein, partial [Deltaproteobacteria bacterium]|nr:RHS repeat protein [Deltaproteobacteria bacterium]
GTIGEPASTGQLTTSYGNENGLVTTITRPGPHGPLTTNIGRDAKGDPVTTKGPDGTITTRTFDDLGRVETQTSSTGASSTLGYDDFVNGSGELETSTVSSVVGTSTTTLGRNALGQAEWSRTVQAPTEGEAPLERSTTTESNELGWTLFTQAGRAATRTVYDAAGRIQSIVSGEDGGHETTTVPGYTKAGMISSITRNQGGVTETNGMTYDDAGRLWTSSKADLTTAYVYDSAGRTGTRTERWTEGDPPEAVGLTTQYGYEAGTGRLVTTTTPGSKQWNNHFDTLGRQVGRSDPAGVRENLILGADGRLKERRLTTVKNEAEVLWAWEEFGYDDIGRQRTRTVHRFPVTPEPDPTQATQLATTTEYFDEPGPKLGLVEWIEDPLKRRTFFDYDDAGREVLRELPDGSKVDTSYYPDGKVHIRTVRFDGEKPWSLTTTTVYDDQGRVFHVTDPGGRTTTTFYDELGRKEQVLAPDSVPGDEGELSHDRLTTWWYGDLGRVVTETRPDGATITRTYDERGNLVAYEDHEGNTTRYHYLKNGRLRTIEYPDGTTREFSYYDDGEMHTITRADATVVTFNIESDTGRLDTIDASDDQPGGLVDFDYDAVGHLTLAFDADAALKFTWDSVGNQLSESLALPGLGFDERSVTRGFDNGNRPENLGMPDGLLDLVRTYAAGDRLVGLTVANQPLWSADYDGGRLTGIGRFNGLRTTFDYDGEGRPTEVRTGVLDADEFIPAPVHRLAFGWTESSLRRSKTREDTRRLIESFHYDGVGHLESDLTDHIPAVGGVDGDLVASVPGLDPRRVEEWWTVNLVDELEERRRAEVGVPF